MRTGVFYLNGRRDCLACGSTDPVGDAFKQKQPLGVAYFIFYSFLPNTIVLAEFIKNKIAPP